MASIYERRGALSPAQHEGLKKSVEETLVRDVQDFFADYDKEYSPEVYVEFKSVFDDFIEHIYAKGAERSFLTPEEHQKYIIQFTAILNKLYEAVQQQDERALTEFTEEVETADESDELTYPEQLAAEIDLRELKLKLLSHGGGESDLLPQQSASDLANQQSALENELDQLYEEYDQLTSAIASGQLMPAATFTRAERQRHRNNVQEFNNLSPEQRQRSKYYREFQAEQAATNLVSEYENILLSHKIFMGIEAHYSTEDILAHLQTVAPDKEPTTLRQQIEAIKRDYYQDQEHGTVSTFEIYCRILQIVFNDRKLTAAAFMSGAVMLGGLAPQMVAKVSQFGRSHDKMDVVEGVGYGVLAILGQTELKRQLGKFINNRSYTKDGVAETICASVIQSSPELFTHTDHALIRQYIDQTIASVQQISATTVEGIGMHISQIIGLAATLAFRLHNPTLFIPVVAATMINSFIAMRGGKNISQAEQAVREASAKFFGSLDQAMTLKQTKGEAATPSAEILEFVRLTKQQCIDTIAMYERVGGLVFPAMLLINALVMDTSQPDFFASYVEGTMYSMQLSAELSALTQQISSLQYELRPAVELTNLRKQFEERGEVVPEKWEINIYDAKRKALHIDELHITPGETIAVIGESGAGKSTLVEVLYGFALERGLMDVDNIDPTALDRKRYREKIMVANQHYVVETKSFKDNVVGDLPVREDVLVKCVQAHGFDRWLEKMQPGQTVAQAADTVILNRGDAADLSGGERKRLALLVIDYRLQVEPDSVKMIILDEPTSGADNKLKAVMFGTIKRWQHDYPDKTIVIVNHDKELFTTLDNVRILGIDKASGELVQDEPLADAEKHEGSPYQKIFG